MSAIDWVALGALLAIIAGLLVLLGVHLWRWRKLTPDQRDWAQGRVPVSILESLVRTDGPARPATEDATARTGPGEGDGTGSGPAEAHGTAEGIDLGDPRGWTPEEIRRREEASTALEAAVEDDEDDDCLPMAPCGCCVDSPSMPEPKVLKTLRCFDPEQLAAMQAAVVEQFKTALLTGLDGLQRHGQFKLVDPEDVGELIARVAQEVGRG